ncbi:MAG: hypothetical protein AAFU03_16035, partial [Bacteroidota bacterium]
MDNFEFSNGDYLEYDTYAENDPYFSDAEYIEDDENFGTEEAEERRLFFRGNTRMNRRLRSMNRRILALRNQIRQLGRRAGTPANLARRLKELESSLNRVQQGQLLANFLNIPQLES